MIEVPILTCKGKKVEIFKVILEKKPGNGHLYVDTNLCFDSEAYRVMRTAFNLMRPKMDILIKYSGRNCKSICGGSLGLPIYLGMYAFTHGLKINPKAFATGFLNTEGKVGRIGCLAEKIKAVLGKGEIVLVPKGQGIPVTGIRVLEVGTAQEAAKMLFPLKKKTYRKF